MNRRTQVSGNDRCSDAFQVPWPGGTFRGDTGELNDDFTLGCVSPVGGAPDAVFAFNLEQAGMVRASVRGDLNSALAITRDDCGGEELACSDDTLSTLLWDDYDPHIQTDLAPGEYRLLLDGTDDGSRAFGQGAPVGRYELEVVLLPITVLEHAGDCAAATTVVPPGGSYRGSSTTPSFLRFEVDRRTELFFDTSSSQARVRAQLRSGSCDGPVIAEHDGSQALSSAWLAVRRIIEPGHYFIRFEEAPDASTTGFQIDVLLVQMP